MWGRRREGRISTKEHYQQGPVVVKMLACLGNREKPGCYNVVIKEKNILDGAGKVCRNQIIQGLTGFHYSETGILNGF